MSLLFTNTNSKKGTFFMLTNHFLGNGSQDAVFRELRSVVRNSYL